MESTACPFPLLTSDALVYLVRRVLIDCGQETTGRLLQLMLGDRSLHRAAVNCCVRLHGDFGWGAVDLGDKRRRLAVRAEDVVRRLLDFGRPLCRFCGTLRSSATPVGELLDSSGDGFTACAECWTRQNEVVLVACGDEHARPFEDCPLCAALLFYGTAQEKAQRVPRFMRRSARDRALAIYRELHDRFLTGDPYQRPYPDLWSSFTRVLPTYAQDQSEATAHNDSVFLERARPLVTPAHWFHWRDLAEERAKKR